MDDREFHRFAEAEQADAALKDLAGLVGRYMAHLIFVGLDRDQAFELARDYHQALLDEYMNRDRDADE